MRTPTSRLTPRRGRCLAVFAVTMLSITSLPLDKTLAGELRVSVQDASSNLPLAARLYLVSDQEKHFFFEPAEPTGSAVPYDRKTWFDASIYERHTTISAHPVKASVPPGQYTLRVERGKTYFPYEEKIDVDDSNIDVTVPLKSWFDPAENGWYSGDTHIHRTVDELKNVVLAEDLNVVFPLTQWVTKSDRPPSAGDKNVAGDHQGELVTVDETHVIWPLNTEYEIFEVGSKRHTLGALFVLGQQKALERGVPPWRPVVEEALQAEPRPLFDMDKLDWPFAMVLPPLVPDSLYEVANNHMWRTRFAYKEWNTKSPSFIQPPFGAEEGTEREWIRYTMGMYYTLLNCGFRMTPSAGTANGVHPVPAGFSRVYVHQPDGFEYASWREELRDGRSFVTTGPMLFVTAQGQQPGHVFEFEEGAASNQEIELNIETISQVPLLFGEIFVDGRPARLLRPENQMDERGAYRSRLHETMSIKRSGWFAVRFWEEHPHGRVRFAHTAPWYVNVGDQSVHPHRHERDYLVDRMKRELKRSQGIVSDAGIEEYREAITHYQGLTPRDNAAVVRRQSRPFNTEQERARWLDNMVVHHQLSPAEIRLATGISYEEAQAAIRERTVDADQSSQKEEPPATVKLLPYPGGRHPRMGFLEGAINPQRETKVSVFSPWEDDGYVVVDLPEAIFSNLGLTYLAHTHVPTIWSEKSIELERKEWESTDEGLQLTRVLPNGIAYTAKARAEVDGVSMELAIENSTDDVLSQLRSQVCVMLKGMPGFNHQLQLSPRVEGPFVAVSNESADRWIITAWTPTHRTWTNPPVPCLHADPLFNDCAPGETVRAHGRLWFYEGKDVDAGIDRLAEQWKVREPH